MKEGRDGEERVREGGIGGRPERNRERQKAGGESEGVRRIEREDRSIGKGERHGWAGRVKCAREGRADSRRSK